MQAHGARPAGTRGADAREPDRRGRRVALIGTGSRTAHERARARHQGSAAGHGRVFVRRPQRGDGASIDATADGRISAINVLNGGFMGFGGRVFTVPEERFGLVGTVVRIRLTAEEVQKLPHQRP
jgi:hypothetical protein